jgi:hypothetical protein
MKKSINMQMKLKEKERRRRMKLELTGVGGVHNRDKRSTERPVGAICVLSQSQITYLQWLGGCYYNICFTQLIFYFIFG